MNRHMKHHVAHALLLVFATAAAALPGVAGAQSEAVGASGNAQASGVLELSAEASADVATDVVHITLFHEEQSSDPRALTEALTRATDAALAQTRKQSAVSVSSGSFSVSPTTDRDGRIATWRGRSELLLTSKDIDAASRLAGQLGPGMQVSDIGFTLSREAQTEARTRLTAAAIASFRQQAQEATQGFGYGSYTIRRVSVAPQSPGTRRPMYARVATMMSAAPAAPVPLEAGKTTVTVQVSGSVQMLPR